MSRSRRPKVASLSPPAGYRSWLAYAVATMDDRSLQNDHDIGLQPQWPGKVTREQMRSAAKAELEWIEGLWSEMKRAWSGKLETTQQLADWAELQFARAETKNIRSNSAAMKAIQQHKAGKTKFGKLSDI